MSSDSNTGLQLRSLIKKTGELELSLKNPEYQLTKTIKKTVSEFSSVDALFALPFDGDMARRAHDIVAGRPE